MQIRSIIFGAFAALLIAPSARAQSVTVGTENSNNCFPFGCPYGPTRYQQVYSASAFSSPFTIDSLVFSLAHAQDGSGSTYPGWTRPATYQVSFGLTNAGPGALSTDYQANESSPEQVFGTFVDGGTLVTSYYSLVGTTPFVYDPSQGNLLLDITVSNIGPNYASEYATFASDASGTATSRVYGAGGVNYDNPPIASVEGLVTGFNGYGAITTPEPASLALLGTGLVGLLPFARRRR